MNKEVGVAIGTAVGNVLEVRSGQEGGAVGRCIRIRAMLNINKPLIRWTNVNIEGSLRRIFLRYEKLANFCQFCGHLDHVDRECKVMIPDEKKHFGPWLRANAQNPISLKKIALDIERINPKPQPLFINQSPRTPTANPTLCNSSNINSWSTQGHSSSHLQSVQHQNFRKAPLDEPSSKIVNYFSTSGF